MKNIMKIKDRDKDRIEYSQLTQKLNDLLDQSNYSKYTNKLFDNLALPPGFYVKPIKSTSTTIICNHNNCSECIDDKIFSELLQAVTIDDVQKSNKRGTRSKISKNSKKSKKNK